MKTFGKITCSILAMSAVIMLAACSSGEFSHKKMVSFCRKHGCEICDEPEQFSSDSSHLMRNVLIIWATNRNFDILDDFCKTFRVIPPAGEE